MQTDPPLCGKHKGVNISQPFLFRGTLVQWVFLCVTASSVAAALRAAGSCLNRASFVQDFGLCRLTTLQRQPVSVSRTHELLMHLAGSLHVAVAGEGRGSSSDRCRAGVKSVTSWVYYIDYSDLTLATKLSALFFAICKMSFF